MLYACVGRQCQNSLMLRVFQKKKKNNNADVSQAHKCYGVCVRTDLLISCTNKIGSQICLIQSYSNICYKRTVRALWCPIGLSTNASIHPSIKYISYAERCFWGFQVPLEIDTGEEIHLFQLDKVMYALCQPIQ